MKIISFPFINCTAIAENLVENLNVNINAIKCCFYMDITTLPKDIEYYLRGFGYQEISKRIGIAGSTIKDIVNIWKKCQTGTFDKALDMLTTSGRLPEA